MAIILPLVVIDPAIGADEAHDARLVEVVEGVQARPRGERDPGPHARERGQDDLGIVPSHDLVIVRMGHMRGQPAARRPTNTALGLVVEAVTASTAQ